MAEEQKLHLLIVEDDADDFLLLQHMLWAIMPESSVQLHHATSMAGALAQMQETAYDLLIIDYMLGDGTGLDLLRQAKLRNLDAPAIFLTGHGNEDVAVEAMKAGAADYLLKSRLTESSLRLTIRYAINLHKKEKLLRQARQTIRKSEERFRALVENSSDIVSVLDAQGTVTYVSPSIQQVLGHAPSDVIGKHAFHLLHPDDTAAAQQVIAECLRQPGVPVQFEYRYKHRNGGWRWLEATGVNRLDVVGVGGIVVNSRDVTDRWKAEVALRSAHDRLQQAHQALHALFHASPLSIVEFDRHSNIVRRNPAARQMFGWEDRELAGKPIAANGEIGGPLLALVERVRQGERIFGAEMTCRRKDGATIDINVYMAPLVSPTGETTGAVALIADTSEHKRTEQEIRRLNRALRALSRCNQALIHAAGKEELLQVICRILVEEGGYQMAWVGCAESDPAKSVRPIASAGVGSEEYVAAANVTWDESDRGCGPMGTAIRTGGLCVVRDIWSAACFAPWREQASRHGYTSTAALPLTIGPERWGALAIYSADPEAFDAREMELLTELAANVSYGLRSLREQKERQLAEIALRKLSRQNELLLNSAGEGIVGLDPEGRITFINAAAANLLGWKPEELIGRSSHQTFHSKDREGRAYPEAQCPVCAAFHDGVVHQSASEGFWRRDGTWFPIEVVSTPVSENGGVVGAVLVFKDITERQLLQEQLLQAQKMEAIGQLAGGVAHDFNNLLMVIGSYSELLMDKLTDEQLRRQTEQIRKAAKRASALTSQLLAFSRKQVLAPQFLNLNDIVHESAKMLPRLIGENIQVKLSLAPQLTTVKADPVQVEQVIMNLVINARDAMPKGGKLVIETADVEVGEPYSRLHTSVTPGKYVMLAISDTGLGIDPALQARVFEPFFTTKERGKGTGLGLSTVYGIIKQSGGHIFLYSEVGRGTTFKIYLPAAAAEPRSLAAESPPEAELQGTGTILVVEDEEAVRRATVEFLESRGYHILEAENGEHGLRVAGEHRGEIDLLLTDVVLPAMSGPDLAQKLLDSHPAIKVLYMSGYTETAILEQAGENMAAIFLQKPFTFAALSEKIRKVLPPKGVAPAA
ncbi:MAG: PAS domain S-box protein [Terriglobales bacterium]